jgi:hypothetical protein
MMEAASTSETLVNFYQTTRRYNPEDSHLRAHRIALMMEAARTSETLVNFYQTTRRYNPEDSHLRLYDISIRCYLHLIKTRFEMECSLCIVLHQ